MTGRGVEVYLDRESRQVRVGTAHFTASRGGVSTTFTYDAGYLGDAANPPVDPALPLFSGNQYVPCIPGAFSDSAPDRWGRNLLVRRERLAARADERTARSLDDVDFLLGVSDETRQGALRYKLTGGGRFLSPHAEVPRLVHLAELLRASDDVASDSDGVEAYKILLAAGTASLGGARPKASVRLDDGSLGIAKLPHGTDRWDVMAWEAVALELAERAGVWASKHRLVKVGERNVLLVWRFDRQHQARIGYMSAMTMLEQKDGAGGDYVEIAERLADHSASLGDDRRELFDRAALNVALHNTDDHLRNHGLLLGKRGWRLSPLFDVNPNPHAGERRTTSIAGATAIGDEWDGLMELAHACNVDATAAHQRVGRIAAAAAGWRELAGKHHIPASQQSLMADVLDERTAHLVEHAKTSPTRSRRPTPSRARTSRGRFASGSTGGSR